MDFNTSTDVANSPWSYREPEGMGYIGYLQAGGMLFQTRLYLIQLYQYFGRNTQLNLVIQGLWLFMNVTQIIKTMVLLKKHWCLEIPIPSSAV